MIWIGLADNQFIDVNIFHTEAVYKLLKEKLWDKLNQDEQESLDAQIEFFDDVFLGEWREGVFNEAYKLLMASDDDLITPMRDDFKIAFESDPRFQAA